MLDVNLLSQEIVKISFYIYRFVTLQIKNRNKVRPILYKWQSSIMGNESRKSKVDPQSTGSLAQSSRIWFGADLKYIYFQCHVSHKPENRNKVQHCILYENRTEGAREVFCVQLLGEGFVWNCSIVDSSIVRKILLCSNLMKGFVWNCPIVGIVCSNLEAKVLC